MTKRAIWWIAGASGVLVAAIAASCGGSGGTGEEPLPCDTVYADLCGVACSSDEDCAEGLYCTAAGTCTADCADGARGCGEGTCTVDGRCLGPACDLPALAPLCGTPCVSYTDCGAGTYCGAAGVCTADCAPSGPECDGDEVCSSRGQCQEPNGLVDSGPDPTDAPFDACTGSFHEQELTGGPLDIYFIFDRTASMGTDCAYEPGAAPPESSKACFATYAFSDYLTSVSPQVDTRLAFQFMSLADNDCNGDLYATPLVPLTPLPMAASHPLIQAISDEQFQGGFGTHIEGALLGIADYTANNQTPGREMIGVLMTDGDPNGCEEDIDTLRGIVAEHLAASGVRTFIIGMEGATNANLEAMAIAGGAEPHTDWCAGGPSPCHYWNVGDGSGDAIASALQAIIGQAAPLPCELDVASLEPPAGEVLDFGKVNVTLTDREGTSTTIGQVPSGAACPADQLAWYYDNPDAPQAIHLCPNACETVTGAASGSQLAVVLGCQETVVIQ